MEQRKSPFLCGVRIVPGLLLLISFHVPRLYAHHDTSMRTDLNFSYTFNEQFQAVSYVFIQADQNISNDDYGEWGIGLQYQTPLSWLSFLIYYQQGYSKEDDRHWELEQKPSVNMNTQVTLSGFRISNQIRFEYRIRPEWNDYRIDLSNINSGWEWTRQLIGFHVTINY